MRRREGTRPADRPAVAIVAGPGRFDKDARNLARIEIYKKGQGRYTRIGTFVSVVGLGMIGAVVLSKTLAACDLGRYATYIQYGVPTLIVIALGIFMFWIVNRPKTADFLIGTEGEMKKVSWSSRKEVIGSTKVVIVTTLIMTVIIFGVDMLFVLLFRWLHIMG